MTGENWIIEPSDYGTLGLSFIDTLPLVQYQLAARVRL